jgi:hypothetical protein
MARTQRLLLLAPSQQLLGQQLPQGVTPEWAAAHSQLLLLLLLRLLLLRLLLLWGMVGPQRFTGAPHARPAQCPLGLLCQRLRQIFQRHTQFARGM